MELMLVPVPLFDKFLSVEAYLFRYQLANQEILLPTEQVSPPLEAVNAIGTEAFAGAKPILVPVSTGMLPGLLENCIQPAETTTFFLEDIAELDGEPRRSMTELRKKGYGFAVLQQGPFIVDDDLLKKTSYVLFGAGAMAGADRKPLANRYSRFYKNVRVVATGLNTLEEFERAKQDGFQLFEGMFYRVPVNQSDRGLNPIKSNLIRLLNMVRDENFEFREIAAILRQDTALSYSLMRFINSPYLGLRYKVKSIQQAVAILGQIEMRKWITAAVVKELGADRPDELTRVSLVRAKFAENLAPLFGLPGEGPSLFLAGLFSVLDAMLNIPIEEAFRQVMVSDEIADALVRHTGSFAPVIEYIVSYERADWRAIMARNMKYGVFTPDVYSAYIDSVGWYNDLLSVRLQSPKYPHSNLPHTRPGQR